MGINYKKLWRMCVEYDISASALFKAAGLSSETLFQMKHNNSVSLRTIDKLCTYFKCQPCEIMEVDNSEYIQSE